MSLGLYSDAECTKPLELGENDFGAAKDIPFYARNEGQFRLIKVSLECTYPDTRLTKAPPAIMTPGEVAQCALVWQPGEITMQLAKSGRKREGGILQKYKEVIE